MGGKGDDLYQGANVLTVIVVVLGLVLSSPVAVMAGEADVLDVKVFKESGGTFRFDVTIAHGDTGWDHYADRWLVLGPDGAELGRRVLLHPHVNEQPFTRSLGGISIPDSLNEVVVMAHDKVHGTGGKTKRVRLPR